MHPVRFWALLGIPLAAVLGRFSAGVPTFENGATFVVLGGGFAFAGVLWLAGGLRRGARSGDRTERPPMSSMATGQELEELRRECSRLRWTVDWQERLLQHPPTTDVQRERQTVPSEDTCNVPSIPDRGGLS